MADTLQEVSAQIPAAMDSEIPAPAAIEAQSNGKAPAAIPSERKKRNKRVFEETAASSRPKRVAVSPPRKRTRSASAAANPITTASRKQIVRRAKGVAGKKAATTTKTPSASGKAGRPPKKKMRGRHPSGATEPAEDEPIANGKAKEEDEDESEEDHRSYWLMKAEPESRLEKGVDVKFSIDDLREAKEPEPWDGVRNPAARNHMRAMRKGDLAFFYHSNCKVPGIAGIMEIVREHSVDETAFDPAHPYFDPKSDRANPKWELVHVQFKGKFKELIRLTELKSYAKPGGVLENLQMLKQSRLSVSAVTPKQWRFIMSLGKLEDDEEKKE
ncbi:hypothetical protein VTO42DRAFT_4980 [Malbranchea cinnamomea]